MAVKYLDNAGTQYLVNKIKAIDGKIPTESQITTMITTALNTYKEGIVTIVESLPQTGEEGKLYLMVDPSDSDVYIIYTWEENAFKRMGSKTFTLTVDSALSSTSTNPVQNKVIKSALDGKANSSHTHGSITNDGKLGTASRVVITGTDKKIGISTVTTTELGYLSGVTSAIQTQLNSKSATGHTHTAGDVAGLATVATSGSYNDLSNKPSIPIKISDLQDDVDMLTSHEDVHLENLPNESPNIRFINNSPQITWNEHVYYDPATTLISGPSYEFDDESSLTSKSKIGYTNSSNSQNTVEHIYGQTYGTTKAFFTMKYYYGSNEKNAEEDESCTINSSLVFTLDPNYESAGADTYYDESNAQSDVSPNNTNYHLGALRPFNSLHVNDVYCDNINQISFNGVLQALTSFGTHTEDTDIHVTTADKNKWNNGVSQAFVFRYSSTALVASSTNSNALLDNTDNLKVGDKVIDSSGVLFSITAIDTANSTFTIGTALIDLAQDSDVVHKSRDESVIGSKRFGVVQSFTGFPTIRLYSTTDDINVLPSYSLQQDIRYTDSNNNVIAYFVFQHRNNANEPFRTCWRQVKFDGTNGYYSINFNNLGTFYPENNNAIDLGGQGNRWKSVYATNYYYGSNNVEFSDKFVTTDTAQTISGVKTFSDNPVIGNNNTNITISNRQITANSSYSAPTGSSYSFMQLKAIVNYADSSPSIDATVGLSIQENAYSDGKRSGFNPNSNNTINLGLAGKRWANVYATNYYYGSNEVEFSQKFVTTDTDQTISGSKTFNGNTYVYNSDNTATTPTLFLKNSKTSKGSTSETGSQLLKFIDKNNNGLCDLESIVTSTGSCELRLRSNTLDSNNQNVQTGVTLISSANGGKNFCPTSDNNVFLGASTLKWARVYSTQYYYGNGNVEFSTKFVTTDTNQTIHGAKTFNNHTYIYDPDATATTPNLYLRSSKIEISSQGNTSGDQNLTYLDKNKATYAYIKGAIQSNGSAVKIRAIAKDSSDNSVVNELQMLAYTNGNKAIFPTYSNEVDLGISSFKWKSFNGVEPSSLSLPDLANGIDISSYLDVSQSSTNYYTPPANGWISISINTPIRDSIQIECGGGFRSGVLSCIDPNNSNNYIASIIVPCIKNDTATIYFKSSQGGTIKYAYFYPCQGNI